MQQLTNQVIEREHGNVPSFYYKCLTMNNLVDKITELLNQRFAAPEYQHLFVVEIQQLPHDIINVFIDSDTGLDIDDCAKISRFLEEHIETNQWLGEKYTLEVSSPGLSKPLKLKRQYAKNLGREVSVETLDSHKHIKGILAEVKDDTIVLTYEERIQIEGTKKKKNIEVKQEIPFDKIKQTVVKISFK